MKPGKYQQSCLRNLSIIFFLFSSTYFVTSCKNTNTPKETEETELHPLITQKEIVIPEGWEFYRINEEAELWKKQTGSKSSLFENETTYSFYYSNTIDLNYEIENIIRNKSIALHNSSGNRSGLGTNYTFKVKGKWISLYVPNVTGSDMRPQTKKGFKGKILDVTIPK